MNPLFNAFPVPGMGQGMPVQGGMGNPMGQNIQETMSQLQANPGEALKKAGYNVPEELAGNPQAMTMHLLQTGQISNPMMQRIAPMLQMMGVR